MWLKGVVGIALVLLGWSAWAEVDINSATETQLRTVKGIGHTRAQAILAWRGRNGSFHNVADLRRVKGFGDKTIAKVGPHLMIHGVPLVVAHPSGGAVIPKR
ncbi:MAG: helix-hairpin-helix domain-containing protein [Betaproteobacteria bacterium]|jgi:DNA uptake protein and related DNA-binding proteins|nr:helix-hairpin-helix domain-containing protein [Betaproteobacteria bacterium]